MSKLSLILLFLVINTGCDPYSKSLDYLAGVNDTIMCDILADTRYKDVENYRRDCMHERYEKYTGEKWVTE